MRRQIEAETGNANLQYRQEIDGLRAVAVAAVVLYHAGFAWLPGGYLGVDVFFVISGYLITRILLRDICQNTYSWRGFILRRIRRIIPALFLMLLVSAPFAYYLLPENDLYAFAESLRSSVLFTSNYFFWLESGYFDRASEFKPLIHTWSLSVEEQFYLIFPWLLYILYKRSAVQAGLVILILASFGLATYGTRSEYFWPFYFLPTRAWELGVGSLLAAFPTLRAMKIKHIPISVRNFSSFLGIVFLFLAFMFFDDSHDALGMTFLVPVIATIMIIGGAEYTGLVKTLLSAAPLRWLGLVSYSLYLWHQPVLVYGRFYLGTETAEKLVVPLLFISVFLAALSYKVVEAPLRNSLKWSNNRILLLFFATGLLLVAVSYALSHSKPYVKRDPAIPAGEISHTFYHDKVNQQFTLCSNKLATRDMEIWKGIPRCHLSGNEPPKIAFFGDSHAEQLFVGAASQLNVSSIYLIRGGLPFTSAPKMIGPLAYIGETQSVETVVFSAFWNDKIQSLGINEFARQLALTLAEFVRLGKRVVLVIDIPVYPFSPEQCIFNSTMINKRCTLDVASHLKQRLIYKDLFDVISEHEAIEIVDLSRAFCDADKCTMVRDRTLLYRDYNHLNWEGSLLAGAELFRQSDLLKEYQK